MAYETVKWLQEHEKFILPTLEFLPSYHFSIPRLDEDRPQDPIVQAIPSTPAQSETPHRSSTQPVSTPCMEACVSKQGAQPILAPQWHDVPFSRTQDTDRSMFWGPNPPSNNQHTPFLTEQHLSLLISLQNRSPHSDFSKTRQSKNQYPRRVYLNFTTVEQITGSELLSSLHLLVLGTSSPLYVWDVQSQLFVGAMSSDAFEVNGMSPSILRRLLDLGGLVRRLEQLVLELRGRRTNTTVHALAHGLSSVLTSIRKRLSCGPLSNATKSASVHCLATLWPYYAGPEQLVASLTSMCSRSIDVTPDKFPEIPVAPVDLLSLVYETFEKHLERHSSRDITATMAYILTVSSKPYIHDLCSLLSYGETGQVHSTITERNQFVDLTFEGDEAESHWRSEEGSIDPEGPFPKFISEGLAKILPAAHKSLKILESAQPAHPIFSTKLRKNEISWVWDEEAIKSLWNGVDGNLITREASSFEYLDESIVAQLPRNHDLLADFKVFDLEPGSFPYSECDSQVIFDRLIASFPSTLPNITPSPSLFCEVMFTPLQDHAASLSRALLSVFLDRSSVLCVDAHLELLRSHILLTSHSFKSRLSAALFSDAEDRQSHSIQLYNLLRYRSKGAMLHDQPHSGRWPVGLAPLLVTRDSWPPGGSELSFLLRTVIVDSQQNSSQSAESNTSDLVGAYQVTDEAEIRLGFAIRELSGRDHDRWLDPLSIEALDFLYLDYKVPRPLEALIPQAVLSKYQRIFALLLRLTRVECAIRSVFRLTRATALPLFPTLSPSRRLLLHFRFVAHSFLSTLSAYIYDTAIGGNFNAFLLRIAICRETPDAPNAFKDVFALAECHSSVLDDILSACLLRSSQRTAGDLLRGTLEVILEFCVLMGDLKDGRAAEYQASPALEALYGSFRKKVSALIRTLEVMLERHGKSRVPGQLQGAHSERESCMPPGGVDSLWHFLTCLNQNNWWLRS